MGDIIDLYDMIKDLQERVDILEEGNEDLNSENSEDPDTYEGNEDPDSENSEDVKL